MNRRPRCNHSPAVKPKVALAAVKGERTIAQLAEHFDVPSPVRVARPAGCRGVQDRPPACKGAHATDGIEAHYRRPRTTKPEPGHKIYPLLRGMQISRPNQIWAVHPHGA